jgi:hypothetical protein
MNDKTSHDVKWNEFIKLLKIEHDKLQKEFQRGLDHADMNFEGSAGPRPIKRQKRKKHVEKKEKILTKLVVKKEDKGFDVAKCQLIDNTLGKRKLTPFQVFPLMFIASRKHHSTLFIVHSRISIKMRLQK